jgi:hypothetical protein
MGGLPEENVVGRSKPSSTVMTSADWYAAKNHYDVKAADRLVYTLWSPKKTEQVKGVIAHASHYQPGVPPFESSPRVVFMTVPSSSRTNVLPIQLARRLASELGGTCVIGDEFFNALHAQQSKHISRLQRPFHPRDYALKDKYQEVNALKRVIGDKQVVIVEDLLTTGGSAASFFHALNDHGIRATAVVALMGERRLKVDAKTEERLGQALAAAAIPIHAGRLSHALTRAEAGGIIMLLNSARSHNAKVQLAKNLQGILDRRPVKGLGRDQDTGRNQGAQGKDPGDGRAGQGVSPRAVFCGEPAKRIGQGAPQLSFHISVKAPGAGKEISSEFLVDPSRFPDTNGLKAFLAAEALGLVRRKGLGGLADIKVTIRPAGPAKKLTPAFKAAHIERER